MGKDHRLRNHPVANTVRLKHTDMGLRCWWPTYPDSSPPAFTALCFRSKRLRTYDFHRTLGRPRALVTSVAGSLRRAPGKDSHLLSVIHATRTTAFARRKSRALPSSDVVHDSCPRCVIRTAA